MAQIPSPSIERPAPGRRNKSAAGKAPSAKKVATVPSPAPAQAALAAGRTKIPAKNTRTAAPAKALSAPIAAAPKPDKAAKAPKPKLVRDSFTIPKEEYAVLAALKTRALRLEQHVRKSELLRAGIQALNAMSDGAFLKAISAVPTLKTGRPKKA